MKRWYRLALYALAGQLSLSCLQETEDPGPGSNTNWLKPCDTTAACGSGMACVCGICTYECFDDCGALSEARCAEPGSAAREATCGTVTPELDAVLGSTAGICLPACDTANPCGPGRFCLEGSCIDLHADSDCPAGSNLELHTGDVALKARYGMLFADDFYLPVSHADRPEGWVEPITVAPITARVTLDGAPIAGCRVRFFGSTGGGWPYPEAELTDAGGEVRAVWVAGPQSQQQLTAAISDADARVVSASVQGEAVSHADEPQATGEAATRLVSPTTLNLSYSLESEVLAIRARVTPLSFPHHAFYAPIAIAGLFTGLQNTSDANAKEASIPSENRRLIMSAWNVAEGDALLLWNAPGVTCGPHTQDSGGIQCRLASAWELGQSYEFTLEIRKLADQEAPTQYAELGYVTDPCTSVAGCTDYTLFIKLAEVPGPGERIAALRYHRAAPITSFGSFVQPYLALESQTSCLETPLYEALFAIEVQNAGEYRPVKSASASATYQTWHNEVCANYAMGESGGQFWLSTGGGVSLGPPQLPGEPARQIELP